MSNLLPERAQKKVIRTHRARFVIAISLTLIVLACVFFLALIPSYLSLAMAPRTGSAEAVKRAEASKAVARAQMIIEQALPVLSSTSTPSMYLHEALAVAPRQVVIQRIMYTKASNGASLMLVGEAPREKVAAFRDALSSHALFTSATVPVSALVGTGSGHFSLTLEIAGGSRE